MKDVMIDFETLGNSNNAVVVQIGACYFDRKTGEIGYKFETNIDNDIGIINNTALDVISDYECYIKTSEVYRKIKSIINHKIHTLIARKYIKFIKDFEIIDCNGDYLNYKVLTYDNRWLEYDLTRS